LLVNKVIKLKKESKAHCVAVILSRKYFSSEDAFVSAISDITLNANPYYIICWRGDFLPMTKKLECPYFIYKCGACKNEINTCEHSCLPRLLWLLFDRDDHVRDLLRNIASTNN